MPVYGLASGDKSVLTQEEKEFEIFRAKPRTLLSPKLTSFKCSNLTSNNSVIHRTQVNKVAQRATPESQKAVRGQRALAQSFGAN